MVAGVFSIIPDGEEVPIRALHLPQRIAAFRVPVRAPVVSSEGDTGQPAFADACMPP
jgi:hypothetical protein